MNERKPGHKTGAATSTLLPEQRRHDVQKRDADPENQEQKLSASVAEITTAIADKRKELQDLRARIVKVTEKHDQILAEIKAEASSIREQETEQLRRELVEIRNSYDETLRRLANQSQQLTDSVQNQADRLFELKLITKEQRATLLGLPQSDAATPTSDWPTLTDLQGGYPQLASHLQRYLYRKQIIYPRALLATFHALMLTGDFIILSGLSGSGKTMLVKSYAKATGNVAHIIPVKPNWTSAEDLIGFYNPLQRAYTGTPFIEALFAASRDPGRLYIICLDEMNLARVEYYFADFLSQLEERKDPSIDLYPDDEAGHVLTELRVLVQALLGLSLDLNAASLETLLADRPTMALLAERLALADGESFPQLHARIRRMLSGALTVPSRLPIPGNVRFVGAVNMDDTTHYLSPKVLDRAHVLQFQSPLEYWDQVRKEVGGADRSPHGIRIPASRFPNRAAYPEYDAADPLVASLTQYAKEFLAPLGIELGMRPMRQAMLYRDRLAELYEANGLNQVALNNLLRQKLLPRLSFDGKQRARGRGEQSCAAIVDALRRRLADDLPDFKPFNAKRDLDVLVARAEANDGIFNYWA